MTLVQQAMHDDLRVFEAIQAENIGTMADRLDVLRTRFAEAGYPVSSEPAAAVAARWTREAA